MSTTVPGTPGTPQGDDDTPDTPGSHPELLTDTGTGLGHGVEPSTKSPRRWVVVIAWIFAILGGAGAVAEIVMLVLRIKYGG